MQEEVQSLISLALSRDGFRQILAGSVDEASALFTEALALDESNAYARLGLAEVAAHQEELASALPLYRDAVERARPEDRRHFLEALVAALIRAAVRARDAGDKAQAERYFEKALLITTSPTIRMACHEGLASLCADSGRKEAAAWHFSKALAALDPSLSRQPENTPN